MYCGHCGAEIEEGSKFCPNCGAPIDTTPIFQTVPTHDEGLPKKKNNIVIIVGIAVAALIVVIAGVIIGMRFIGSSDTVSDDTNPASGIKDLIDQNIKPTEETEEIWLTETSKTYVDGEFSSYSKYEYDDERITYKRTDYNADDMITGWAEGYVDEEGKQSSRVIYDRDGNVTREYTYKDGKQIYYIDYDEYGNITEVTVPDQRCGTLRISDNDLQEVEITVDADQNPVSAFYDSNGVSIPWFKYIYDENGNALTRTIYYKDGDVKEKDEFIYDVKGNLLTQISEQGVFTFRNEYTYDENGNQLTTTYYTITENLETISRYIEYTYDKAENLLKDITYVDPSSDHELELSDTHEYTYDKNGNMLSRITYDSSGEVKYNYIYTYDSNGNELTVTGYDSDNEPYYLAEYTYDENGNLLTEQSYSSTSGTITQIEYTYIKY